MTIQSISLSTLKKVKNRIIGNPSAKLVYSQDEAFIRTLVECLNHPALVPSSPHNDSIRIEAAHVIGSLSYGSKASLTSLLQTQAPQALLYALSQLYVTPLNPVATSSSPSTSSIGTYASVSTAPQMPAVSGISSAQPRTNVAALTAALTRALRTLASSLADVVGPSQWGLAHEPRKSKIREEAAAVLGGLFRLESLDIYLPLLFPHSVSSTSPYLPTSPHQMTTTISIAQLLASALRNPDHRLSITSWIPPAERAREDKSRRGWEVPEVRIHGRLDIQTPTKRGWETVDVQNRQSHRGWEKTSTTGPSSGSASRQSGGWVARILVELLGSRDGRIQEAALLALAALARDNPSVAGVLGKGSGADLSSPLNSVLALIKSRSIDVQIAACLCATRIRRGSSTTSRGSSTTDHTVYQPTDDTSARTVMNVINGIIDTSATETVQHRTKACFILYHLIADDPALCQAAFDRGSLDKLAALIRSLTPSSEPNSQAWEEDEEPESICALREAALTATAALSLFSNDIRRAVTDDFFLLPIIQSSLTHRHVGIRYAACQCVRALSRAVAVLRTNLVDSGLGLAVFATLEKELGEGKGKDAESDKEVGGKKVEEGDRRVVGAALAAVCNIVNEFSPLRPIFLEKGLMTCLLKVLEIDDVTLKVSALWAVKNLLKKSSTETKRDVMSRLGWTRLIQFFSDPDEKIQEQALNVVRNLAENDDGVSMVFREIGASVLLQHLTTALKSTEEDVVLQAAYILANLSNGETEQQDIISHPQLLDALRSCLAVCKSEIRRPVVGCILELASSNPKRRKQIVEAGFVSTLRHMCEWTGVVGSPGAVGSTSRSSLAEDDRDVIEEARRALDWLEHGDAYVSS